MKKILLYTSPARGHLYPIIDLAISLKNQGDEVAIQTLSSEKEHVTNEGLKHLDIATEIENLPLRDYHEKNPLAQIKSTFKTWAARAPFEIYDLEKSYADFKPDLLIADVNTWGAASFAEMTGNPWGLFLPYCLPLSSSDTPAFGPGFKPPSNLMHRLRDRFLNKMLQNAIKDHLQTINELRTNLELTKFQTSEDLFSRPDLLLYFTSEPFDYARSNWPENIIKTGPGLWAPPGNTPNWLEDLPSPRILVSVSTEKQNDGEIIKTAIDAFAGSSFSLIITSAANPPDSFELPENSGNIKITKYLSHADIIPKIDLVITHGGMGTTQRALSSGVPVCVIPWGRDQKETARRVELSDSGVFIPRSKLNKTFLRKAVKEALSKKPGAEKIARAFEKAGGAKTAVAAIRNLLGHQH